MPVPKRNQPCDCTPDPKPEQDDANRPDDNARNRAVMANTIALMDWMEQDLHEIIAGEAKQGVREDAAGIAYDMGYELTRTLDKADLLELHRNGGTAGIDINALRGFRYADLVIETKAPNCEVHYIVMEVCYTGNAREIRRATRNAQLVTRFTGYPAHPAIASVCNDLYAQIAIDSGRIHHHSLAEKWGHLPNRKRPHKPSNRSQPPR